METTEFMLQLAKELMDTRKVAESTANAYIKSLYALNGKKAFKNLSFLKDIEQIDKTIAEYAESTQRALLATIVSTLGLHPSKAGFKKPYQHFYDKMMERSKEARENETSEKTEKQKENWLSWEDIEKRKGELSEAVRAFGSKKTLDAGQYDTLLQYVVLSLYSEVQPRRNQDYLDMYIVKKWNDKMPKDKNYLDVAGKQFIYEKYKTSKKYNTQKQEIPEALWNTIQLFFRYHPLWKGAAKRKADPVKLLVTADGAPMTAVNAITRLLNKVFGKKVGSSMIRHIFLSDKYKDTVAEMKRDSEAMGHSLTQQREYVRTDGDEND